MPPPRREPLGRLVDSTAFNSVVLVLILGNAAVLGLHTYDAIQEEWGSVLDMINALLLGLFVIELGLRFASYRRPLDFFRDPWNVFDFVVIGAAFVPGLRENTTVLRLVRLARVVRIFRVLPELRILLLAIGRSIPPLGSMALLTAVILFVYGMIGWALFADELPERWGDIGEAMLTLFVMLTLENFPVYLEEGRAVEPWSVVYFVSFILVAAFIVLNVLIGVVLNSLQEAREIHLKQEMEERGLHPTEEQVTVAVRLQTLRAAIDDLEAQLALAGGPHTTFTSQHSLPEGEDVER
jgi:voltage-gated sodium channel